MLQQTQVTKALQYYSRFLQSFPAVQHLAAANLDDVLKMWEGMGYYARARNLHKAARYIVQNHQGMIPARFEALLQVPGIGEYTAAAISSIVYNEPRAVVDGNVKRVLCRLFKIMESPQLSAIHKEIQRTAQKLLLDKRAGDYNQAVMELGATICSPKKPKCLFCPVAEMCQAFQSLPNPAQLPVKKPVKKVPHRNIAVAVLWDDGRIFIAKRNENGVLGGMWDFPSVELKNGETAQPALKHELKNTYGFTSETSDFLMDIKHAFTHFTMTMQVFHCLFKDGEPPLNAARDWCWVKPGELTFYPFAVVCKKIIKRIENEFVPPNNRR